MACNLDINYINNLEKNRKYVTDEVLYCLLGTNYIVSYICRTIKDLILIYKNFINIQIEKFDKNSFINTKKSFIYKIDKNQSITILQDNTIYIDFFADTLNKIVFKNIDFNRITFMLFVDYNVINNSKYESISSIINMLRKRYYSDDFNNILKNIDEVLKYDINNQSPNKNVSYVTLENNIKNMLSTTINNCVLPCSKTFNIRLGYLLITGNMRKNIDLETIKSLDSFNSTDLLIKTCNDLVEQFRNISFLHPNLYHRTDPKYNTETIEILYKKLLDCINSTKYNNDIFKINNQILTSYSTPNRTVYDQDFNRFVYEIQKDAKTLLDTYSHAKSECKWPHNYEKIDLNKESDLVKNYLKIKKILTSEGGVNLLEKETLIAAVGYDILEQLFDIKEKQKVCRVSRFDVPSVFRRIRYKYITPYFTFFSKNRFPNGTFIYVNRIKKYILEEIVIKNTVENINNRFNTLKTCFINTYNKTPIIIPTPPETIRYAEIIYDEINSEEINSEEINSEEINSEEKLYTAPPQRVFYSNSTESFGNIKDFTHNINKDKDNKKTYLLIIVFILIILIILKYKKIY